ncbi:hypothetical protein V6R21_14045 [Limibacter armeniacum]|uniref:SRPBCC family protein n=1 Tax=Limibacter armeniacum TaxID=466084 RepID=UPI002FE5E2F6
MRILVKTKVEQPLEKVWQGFDVSLFNKLNPPFPPVKVQRFDGSLVGNEVHLELNFLLFKQLWVSKIVEQQSMPEKIYFVDKGIRLPFFLSKWTHRHILIKKEDGTEIQDDISFSTGTWLTDIFLLPVLWLQFLYRKPVYRKLFLR